MKKAHWITLAVLFTLIAAAGVAAQTGFEYLPYGFNFRGDATLGFPNTLLFRGGGSAQLRTSQAAVPVCTTNCGSSVPAVAGTDSAGILTLGTAPSNAFVLAFNTAWQAAPACTVTQQTTAANFVHKALTSTASITVTTAAGPTAADKFSYVCFGTQ